MGLWLGLRQVTLCGGLAPPEAESPTPHAYLLAFQASFPHLPPQEPGPLDQLPVLVVVHLPPANLQHVLALHPRCIWDLLHPLRGPFPHWAGGTLTEQGWSRGPRGPGS